MTAILSPAQMNILMHSHLEWKSSVHQRHPKNSNFSGCGHERPLWQGEAGGSELELKYRHQNQVGKPYPTCVKEKKKKLLD